MFYFSSLVTFLLSIFKVWSSSGTSLGFSFNFLKNLLYAVLANFVSSSSLSTKMNIYAYNNYFFFKKKKSVYQFELYRLKLETDLGIDKIYGDYFRNGTCIYQILRASVYLKYIHKTCVTNFYIYLSPVRYKLCNTQTA